MADNIAEKSYYLRVADGDLSVSYRPDEELTNQIYEAARPEIVSDAIRELSNNPDPKRCAQELGCAAILGVSYTVVPEGGSADDRIIWITVHCPNVLRNTPELRRNGMVDVEISRRDPNRKGISLIPYQGKRKLNRICHDGIDNQVQAVIDTVKSKLESQPADNQE